MEVFNCGNCGATKLRSHLRLITEMRWNLPICISCCPSKSPIFKRDVLNRRYPEANLHIILEAIRETNSLIEAENYIKSKLLIS